MTNIQFPYKEVTSPEFKRFRVDWGNLKAQTKPERQNNKSKPRGTRKRSNNNE